MKILDMSAGNRAIWIEKDCELATFLDIRPGMKADFVCDTKAIPAEVGSGFNLIVFDPPHMNLGANSNMGKVYGHFTMEEIRETIRGSGKEAHRISERNALMAFKWNDHDMRLDKVLELFSEWWRPLFGQHLKNRGGSDAKSQSFWVMLLRRN